MDTIETTLRSHPRAEPQRVKPFAEAIHLLAECAETCTSCADACLAEEAHLQHLTGCIRVNLDCAEVCALTARLLGRTAGTPPPLLHAQLHACVIACQLCADACGSHAAEHAHCRVCAETCRRCQTRCNFLLGEISSAGVAEDVDPLESPTIQP